MVRTNRMNATSTTGKTVLLYECINLWEQMFGKTVEEMADRMKAGQTYTAKSMW